MCHAIYRERIEGSRFGGLVSAPPALYRYCFTVLHAALSTLLSLFTHRHIHACPPVRGDKGRLINPLDATEGKILHGLLLRRLQRRQLTAWSGGGTNRCPAYSSAMSRRGRRRYTTPALLLGARAARHGCYNNTKTINVLVNISVSQRGKLLGRE